MPFCRSAFSEALNLGRADAGRRLRAVPWKWPAPQEGAEADSAAEESTREEVAVGGDANAPMWLLDSSEELDEPMM